MVEIDVNKEIRRAVDTGKVIFGSRQSNKNILKGNGELIILSQNISRLLKEKLTGLAKISEIPFYEFKGTSLELGAVCGKPYPVSVMTITNAGKSKILSVTGKTKAKKKDSEKE
ncbi:MAG: 50S ribosomal protein L30e [Candidatus Diapherotrites archaeon]